MRREKLLVAILFGFALLIRGLFTYFFPLNSHQFFHDSSEYIDLSERILSLNFNFDIGRFIRSPLYPFVIALHKLLFGNFWEQALICFQIILSSITCVLIYKIALQLFRSTVVALASGYLVAIYFPIFYYVYAFGSETLYQFLLTLSFLYLIKFLQSAFYSRRYLIGFSILIVLTYLTRPEIGLFFPFLFILFYIKRKKYFLQSSGLFLFIFFILTLPWAIVNHGIHQQYITSGNGGTYVFYLSNSELGYRDAVDIPPIGSMEFYYLTYNYGYFNPGYDSILRLPANQRQAIYLSNSLDWIKRNPDKFFSVKINNLFHFFVPGLTPFHSSFKKWFVSFVFSAPFHLLFYFGVFLALKRNLKDNLWFIAFYLSSVLALTIFLYTSRFRSYSIEIFYLLYGGLALVTFYNKIKSKYT